MSKALIKVDDGDMININIEFYVFGQIGLKKVDMHGKYDSTMKPK